MWWDERPKLRQSSQGISHTPIGTHPEMQTIEFKRGDPSNTRSLTSAISRFIETGYERDPKEYEADLRRLEEMRGEVMAPMVTPTFLPKFRRYVSVGY